MNKKRIIIVTSELVPFHYGGIGTQFKSLAALLKRHGHQVSLLAQRPEKYDANIYRIHYGEIPLFFVDAPPVYAWPSKHFAYAEEVARRFDEVYPQVRPDLVIFADFNAEGLFLLLRSGSGAYEGTEFLLTTQGMNFEVISIREGGGPGTSASIMEHPDIRLLLAMEDLCVHLASRIVSPSVCTRDEIRKRLGIRKNTLVIPNLVDPDLFVPGGSGSRKETREPLILFVGRLDRMKGTDLLLKAYFEIAAQMQPAIPRIIFIGRDCYWNEYGSTFLEYWGSRIPEKYAGTISFLGQVSHDSIRDYLREASVAVFPSRWEPFGIVCLEALSMGCPVVVSRGTGLEEVLGPELLELTVPVTEDIQPLAQKILSILRVEYRWVPTEGASSGYPDLPEHLRNRALEVVRQAEAGWLDLLREIDRRERTEKSDIQPFCSPLYRLFSSLEELSWRGTAHLQIYFRRRDHYTESDSLKVAYSRLRWTTLRIPLPSGTGERPLRLDPADMPGIIRIKEIALLDGAGTKIWQTDSAGRFAGCTFGSGETTTIRDSCLVIQAKTDDPQIFLDCPETDGPAELIVIISAGDDRRTDIPDRREEEFDHYLSLCASIKNESSYLREWIEYHRMVGVDHFYIYDNNSTDNPGEILQEYIINGTVDLIVWPIHPYGQIAAYKDCIRKFKYHNYWIGFVDIDEYIVPIQTETVSEFLKKYEGSNGIGINWLVYGSSGHLKKPEGLTTENFIMRSKTSLPDNKIIKSIVNPRHVSYVANQHFFKFKDGLYVMDEDMVAIDTDSQTRIHKSGKIRINHYFTRSREEWDYKRMKGRTDGTIRSDHFFTELDRNESLDDIMMKYIPELKKKFDQDCDLHPNKAIISR